MRETRLGHVAAPDSLRSVLLVWPAVFFAIFQFVAPYTAERYYLIPHFLLLVALALVFDEIPFIWKKGARCYSHYWVYSRTILLLERSYES